MTTHSSSGNYLFTSSSASPIRLTAQRNAKRPILLSFPCDGKYHNTFHRLKIVVVIVIGGGPIIRLVIPWNWKKFSCCLKQARSLKLEGFPRPEPDFVLSFWVCFSVFVNCDYFIRWWTSQVGEIQYFIHYTCRIRQEVPWHQRTSTRKLKNTKNWKVGRCTVRNNWLKQLSLTGKQNVGKLIRTPRVCV